MKCYEDRRTKSERKRKKRNSRSERSEDEKNEKLKKNYLPVTVVLPSRRYNLAIFIYNNSFMHMPIYRVLKKE